MDPLLQLLIALPLAVLFISASQHKRSDRVRFAAQVGAYSLLPRKMLTPIATALPWVELATGLCLLIPALRPMAASAAIALLATYAAAILINVLRGRTEIDCGCGGPAQPLSGWLVARNGMLAVAALALLAPTTARPLQALDAFALLLITGLLVLSYLTLGQLLHNRAALSGWNAHDA